MPRSPMRNLADLLATSGDLRGNIPNNKLAVESGSSVSTLADMDALIAETGMTTGDQAYVQENNKLYLYNGAGWYLVATVENAQPTAISGVESAYELASDGTATTITAISTDPDGFPLTWSYAVTTGSLGSTASISQTDNVFTITPSTDEANAGEFSITFSVTDGATGVVSAVSAFTLAFGIDISQAVYDNKSFSVASQTTSPFGIRFNTAGTKMYILGTNNPSSVYQYSLTSSWNVNTASYDNVSFRVDQQNTYPRSIAFNYNGSKMYMVGTNNPDSVYQYSLSSGWNLNTASYDNVSFTVDQQDGTPFGIWFNTNGSKMYILGRDNDTVYQYSLSSGWNLNTASYDNVSFSVASQDPAPDGLAFNADGTKMYIVGQSNNRVFQYSLSTPFDISTASYDDASLDVTSQDGSPCGITFKPDDSKMYIIGYAADAVYQYSTGL